MVWGAVLGGVASVAGSLFGKKSADKAANNAMNAQVDAAGQAINTFNDQYDATQALLAPYIERGNKAASQQDDLAGLNGPDAQQAAIQQVQQGPEFMAMQKQGEESILANASATGGLRGGNTQGALGSFSPQLLNDLLAKQFNQFGGIAQQGFAAVGQQNQFGANNAMQVAGQQTQIGQARAGNSLARGNNTASMVNGITNGLGSLTGGIF